MTSLNRRVLRLSMTLVAASFLLWFTVATPGLLRAQNSEPKGICVKLSSMTSNTELKMQNRLEDIEGKRTALNQKRLDRQTDKANQRAEKKIVGETKLAAKAEALYAVAATDVQTAAVATFVTQVEAAVAARVTAVNTSIADWHNEGDRVRDSRRALSDSLIATQTAAVWSAYAESEDSCNEGIVSKIVGPTHKAAIAASKDQLDADIAAFSPMEVVMAPLKVSFKATMDDAHKSFTDALQAATDTLATALGVEASDAESIAAATES
jgi:hypothetical protein